MPTILENIITKKSAILSKILKINRDTNDFSNSSLPNTQLIGKIQERLNNPLFELSISDYEKMCGNKMILRMMTKILGCDEKQLNKFCKYINVFKENIESSPESIKNKMKSKISLKSLPKHLLENIIDKYKDLFPNKYVLLSWIPIDKIDYKTLSQNPNAIYFIKKVLTSKYKYKIDWGNLSENPNAIELLRKYPKKIIYLNLSSNPNAIELLKENYNKINWEYLSLNPNAIDLLRDKINEENEMSEQDLNNLHSDKRANWYNLSSNPNAIELLREKINKENKMSKKELERLDSGKKINWNNLSSNPNAIELLRENPTEIDWVSIHTNVNSIDFLKENPHKILWGLLSENPNAIELLKENPAKIDYTNLSLNPNAIELLKANQDKINWNNLSQNPNAIEILKANQSKINWRYLSGNPNGIELLQLKKEKMDMRLLSANPSIFQAVKKVNTFESINDIKEWCKNPEIHPVNKTHMNAMGKEYKNIYEKAFILMKKYKETDRNIKDLFPKNHILFGNIDIIYYTCIKKYYDKLQGDYYDTAILAFLTENIKNTVEQQTIFETELEILRNVFSNQGRYLNLSNFIMKLSTLISKIATLFIENEYSSFDEIMEDVSCDKTVTILHFLRNNKLNNGEIIMDYINDYDGIIDEDAGTEWISDVKKLIADYDLTCQDIKDYYDVNSGIIINAENKKYSPIDDPIDNYFNDFEEKLAEIRKPMYSKLIDLTTFKPKELRNYLNDEEYSKYKKEKDAYDVSKKKYNEDVLTDSSSVPPEKPKILLPWGKIHIIGREIDPIHIKDDVIIRFNEEYLKATPIIEEYNRIKNMSYIELKKYSNQSPSSSEKKLIGNNELLQMTREEINNNILFDNSDLEDKCSESIDILTNEELNDDNYPLSKLQLMVRLKVYTSDKKYRTECIYAPKLYNYLIKCINEKEPFINPVTKTKYTEDNIKDLMNVMKIIDATIERPIFIKHMNDSKLKINYRLIKETYNDNGVNGPPLSFYNIYTTREIGIMNYEVHNICTIPSDIESSLSINNARFETGSNDLTSYIMLFRIFKLFNEGRLLHKYTQPYKIPSTIPNEYLYIKPRIHFNKYKKAIQWYYNNTTAQYRTPEEYVEMFKHYCEEINSYIY